MKLAIHLTLFAILAPFSCLHAQSSPVSASPAAPPASFRITTLAGGAFAPESGVSTATNLGSIDGITSTPQGAVYLADSAAHRIRLVQPGGAITTIAGDGAAGFTGDNGPATRARLSSPYGLAHDGYGTLFLADFGNARIRRISPTGIITTIAGGGSTTTIPPAGIDPLQVKLSGPRNLALDLTGNLYFTDAPANRLYQLSRDNKLTLLAGDGTGIALKFPAGLAADYMGNLYIADTGTFSILKFTAGKATPLSLNPALPGTPLALASDYYGNLTIGTAEGGLFARALDGTTSPLLTSFPFSSLRAVHQDLSGVLYFSEPARVWTLANLGSLTLFAGSSSNAPPPPTTSDAHILAPMGLALDASGNLYVADEKALRLWRITPSGQLQTAAGTGQAPPSPNSAGDGGQAASARLYDPVAVAISPLNGEIAIAEFSAHRVRIILPTGVIYTAAGTGTAGLNGDNGPAQFAQLNQPRGLAYDSSGNLYIADSGNGLVRKLGRNGFLTTTGPSGLNNPTSLAFDAAGILHVAESGSHLIRRLTANNAWEIVAGTGSEGASTDGLTARLSQFRLPTGLAFDAAGCLYLADTYNHRLRRITPLGLVETIAGAGAPGFSGDDGPALQAKLNMPVALAAGPHGRLYAADLENARIRLLTPSAIPPPASTEPPPSQNNPPPSAQTTLSLLHAATLKPGPFAPGQLVTLFAAALPAAPELRVNGAPAPLFYSSPTQINFQLPYLNATEAQLELFSSGVSMARTTLALTASAPGLFASDGSALAVSPTGALLSPGPGAPRGSVVTLYATGAGLWDLLREAGSPAAAPLARPRLPVSLRIGNTPVELLYAGEAPGLSGVLQLNAQLPGLFTAPGKHEVILTIGPNSSPTGVTLQLY